MICYQCPLCATPLTLQATAKFYACDNQHHFDVAKEGYVNLLPVQHKHSLAPGDNKQMLLARRAFLEAGYFEPLTEKLTQLLIHYFPANAPLQLLDLGCGEGYYSRHLEHGLNQHCSLSLHGIDIAKFAIAAAAKRQPNAHFVVASNTRLPFSDAYFEGVVRVFAPSNASELRRVLKPGGLLITVTPGPRHLWQLKTLIYNTAKEHTEEPALAEGFSRIASERLQYQIQPTPTERQALLHMTPFAWQVNLDTEQQLLAMETLAIDIDFQVTVASLSVTHDQSMVTTAEFST